MIFVNELIKAFCKRTTIAIFAVLLLLNGVLLYINETKQTLEYTPEQYKAAYQTLEGLDTHVAFERISQKKSELELIQRLSFGEDISQENCNAEELLKLPRIYRRYLLRDRADRPHLRGGRRLRKLRQLP